MMPNGLRIALLSAALAAVALPYSNASAQSSLKERLAAAVETVEGACASDVRKFCGNVTRGEGRLLQCMQAYDDQLS